MQFVAYAQIDGSASKLTEEKDWLSGKCEAFVDIDMHLIVIKQTNKQKDKEKRKGVNQHSKTSHEHKETLSWLK